MIDINNTEVAFIAKSNGDLRKAKFLYKVMASSFITRTAAILTKFAMSIRFPINWAVKPTIYSHFVGGETINECIGSVQVMSKFNVKSILDYSVEGGEPKFRVDVGECKREVMLSWYASRTSSQQASQGKIEDS